MTGRSEPGKYLLTKLLIAVVVIWALSVVMIIYILPSWEYRGTFGDSFGAVNALFSGLAFAAILYTIALQQEDIKANREELILNKQEMIKSVKVQKRSYDALSRQVEQTHLSAKMNAMNILVEYYNNQISNPKSTPETIERAREKRREIIKKIDILIDDLQDSDID